ncbi:MAG: pyridoxine 5'-phosphate synthase [Myxococcota bacterium]
MSRRRLVVNVDHVATLRQARRGAEPDPVVAATLALLGGADGIVVHLREDRRHIRDRDVRLLRQVVHELFCLEMAPTQEMLKIALEVRPTSVTLVPERREELTTEGGLDLVGQLGEIGEVVRTLEESEIRSCIFIDPDLDQIKAARRVEARSVEIHMGRYADAGPGQQEELRRICDAARLAAKLKLEVGVGHGLGYKNVRPLVEVEEIEEFSIGHSIVSRATLVGMERAVLEMRSLVG